MSDTDDTDNLLLIPPDFFVLHSDTEDSSKAYGPYYKVVDSLITQVNKLENRVNYIETVSDSSFTNTSIHYSPSDNKNRANLMSDTRRFSSLEDLPNEINVRSTHSTPQKPKTRFKLNSLPSTPGKPRTNIHLGHGDLFVPKRSPHEKVGPKSNHNMLNEIDTFISNVKTIQKYQTARNLNPVFDAYMVGNHRNVNTMDETGDNNKALNLKDVDQMLDAMESHQREIESRLKEREHDMRRNNSEMKENVWRQRDTKTSVPDYGMGMRDILYERTSSSEQPFYKEETWRLGDNKESVPDRGMGMREALYEEQSKPSGKEIPFQTLTVAGLIVPPESSISDVSARNTESASSGNSTSLSSSDSTQMTAYQSKNLGNINDPNKIHTKAMDVLNQHQKLLTRNQISNHNNFVGKSSKSNIENSHVFHNEYEPSTKNTLALLSLSELWNQASGASDVQNFDRSKFLNKLQEEKLRRQHCEQLIQQLQTRTLELTERLAVAIKVDQAKDNAILRIHKSWEEAFSKIDSLTNERDLQEQRIQGLRSNVSFEISEASKKVTHYESESSKALNIAHNAQEKLAIIEKQNASLIAEMETIHSNLKTLQDNYNIELENTQQLSKILAQKEIELTENKNILSDARKEVAQSKRAVEICQSELSSMKGTQNELERHLQNEIGHAKDLEKEKKKLQTDLETQKKMEKSLKDEITKQKQITEDNKIELRNFYQDQVEVVVREKLREFQSQLEKAENSLQDELRSRELSVAKAAAVHIQHITEKHTLEVQLLEEKHKEEVKLYIVQLSKAHQHIENLNVKLQQQQERKTHIAQQLHKIMEAQWLEALKIINSKSPIVSHEKSTNTLDQLNSLKSRSYNNVEEILFKDEEKAQGDYKPSKSNTPFFLSSEAIPSVIEDGLHIKLQTAETPVNSKPHQKTRQQLDQEMHKYIQMLLNKSPGNPLDEPNKQQAKNPSAEDQWQQGNYTEKSKQRK